MDEDTTVKAAGHWYESGHASLCALGAYLQRSGFFRPLYERVHLRQKVHKFTPAQKLVMFVVSLLAGAKAVAHTERTVRLDPALCAAFGLPGCAEQSVIADTLNAATDTDVADLYAALATIFHQHSQARRHDSRRGLLILDLDLSPLPASKRAEGSERGYMGRCRSKTGRKLVRLRAAQYQETVWEAVHGGRTVETLAVVQEAVQAAEPLLGLDGEDAAAKGKRAQVEIRLDSGWGSTEIIEWLLARGYQVTGKFKSPSRVHRLVRAIGPEAWQPTRSPGREVAVVPNPVAFTRPLAQYAVRTPSKDHRDGYYHAVLFSSRTDLDRQETVDHYDDRAGMEADLKADKHGLGLAVIRKQRLAAQTMVVLLTALAHNLLIWSRAWVQAPVPRLRQCGIVRLVQEVWAVPGRVKLVGDTIVRIRLRRQHPRARALLTALTPLLAPSPSLAFWG
jgi:hypothetical protein